MVYFIWWLILTFLYVLYFIVVIALEINGKKKAAMKDGKAQVIASPDTTAEPVEEPQAFDEGEDAKVLNGIPIHEKDDAAEDTSGENKAAEDSAADSDAKFTKAFEKEYKEDLKNVSGVQAEGVFGLMEAMDNYDNFE